MKRLLGVILLLLLVAPASQAQKREPGKVKTVMIDPGHGGDKPGAIGRRCQEKNLVLSVAKKLAKLLQASIGHCLPLDNARTPSSRSEIL